MSLLNLFTTSLHYLFLLRVFTSCDKRNIDLFRRTLNLFTSRDQSYSDFFFFADSHQRACSRLQACVLTELQQKRKKEHGTPRRGIPRTIDATK